MSAWQFRTELLPIEALVQRHGSLPASLPVERLSFVNLLEIGEESINESVKYWSEIHDHRRVEDSCSQLLPEIRSWSRSARMFGDKRGDSVAIWKSDVGKIEDIRLNFNLSIPNTSFVRAALACVSENDCMLHDIQNCGVFLPTAENFVESATRCSAAKFLPQPNCLKELMGD